MFKPEGLMLDPVKQQLQPLFFHIDITICSAGNLKGSA